MKKLIIGCGYLGERVARRWLKAGDDVFALTRSAERANILASCGIRPILGDVTAPDSLTGLPQAETVLYAVGFDRRAGKSMRAVYVDGLRNVLQALPTAPERFLYISSTGVYGQFNGDWVDENSVCQPTREGGVACLAAEKSLFEHPFGTRATVLRLAGLYGPKRVPRRGDIEAGRDIAAPTEGYLNLIHVDDAVEVTLAAEKRAIPSKVNERIFVVADGQPVQRGRYYEEVARLIGAPPPRFVRPDEESPAAQRSGADKRINSRRMFSELQITLKYPSYREGLAAILSEERRN